MLSSCPSRRFSTTICRPAARPNSSRTMMRWIPSRAPSVLEQTITPLPAKAVGFDDDGIFARLQVMTGGVGMIEDAKLGGGHVGMPHELLGEDLARLDLGGLPGGTEDAEPGGLKLI